MATNKVNTKDIRISATAKLNNIRVSPRKARRTIDLVRGRNVNKVLTELKFSSYGISDDVAKLIKSAVANLKQKAEAKSYNLNDDMIFISEIYADEGTTLKRWRPRARGVANRILKRTSHITVVVSESNKDGVFDFAKTTSKAKAAKPVTETEKSATKPADKTKAAGKAHRTPSNDGVKK
ncbi:MAG: 50S ribosomal protein L22, partial [Bifidobacteriaceae bacterium]|nr:50S ribosomal protein L22 [Bifidobacteriaceae bacterium]